MATNGKELQAKTPSTSRAMALGFIETASIDAGGEDCVTRCDKTKVNTNRWPLMLVTRQELCPPSLQMLLSASFFLAIPAIGKVHIPVAIHLVMNRAGVLGDETYRSRDVRRMLSPYMQALCAREALSTCSLDHEAPRLLFPGVPARRSWS